MHLVSMITLLILLSLGQDIASQGPGYHTNVVTGSVAPFFGKGRPSQMVVTACGGQISPGSTRRLEGLANGFGPIVSQGHPFVGQERTAGRMGRRRE
jgi:hypothetical protein